MLLRRPMRVGAPVISSTAGSVLFSDASANLGQDNSNLFWDDSNNRIGVGTTAPGAKIEIETDSATEIGQIIQAAASQSANLFETQDSSGNSETSIDADQHIVISAQAKTWGSDPFKTAITYTTAWTGITSNVWQPIALDFSPSFTYDVAHNLSLPIMVRVNPTITSNVGASGTDTLGLTGFQMTQRVNLAGPRTITFIKGIELLNGSTVGVGTISTLQQLIISTPTIPASHTVTTHQDIIITQPQVSGSSTTYHAIRIAGRSTSGATTNIGVYQTGTLMQNRFVGQTRFGADAAPTVSVHVSGAIATTKTTVSLTADNQVVSTSNTSYISLSSDNATATNRTFVLTQSTVEGQLLTLEWTGTNAAELVDDSAQNGGGNHRMSATWTPTQYDTISFISNGTDWIETSRSTN